LNKVAVMVDVAVVDVVAIFRKLARGMCDVPHAVVHHPHDDQTTLITRCLQFNMNVIGIQYEFDGNLV
jgi:hypothetical protein